MVDLKQVIKEIEGILEEFDILKRGYEPLGYLGMLGKDSEEVAEIDRLITKVRTLISKNCGIESEYYKSLERDSRKRGRNYLDLCISTLKAYYENLKNNYETSPETKKETIIKGENINKRAIFVVHGRNEKIRNAMFEFLRAIGLDPIEWEKAIKMTGKPNPHIDEILIKAFDNAQSILVIFTPDDLAKLKPHFHKENDPPYEKELTGQARPNVLFEAGMGYGRDPDRTVLVQIGKLKPFSDISGRHLIQFKGTPEDRKRLAERLKLAGCDVSLEGTDWLKVGDFTLIDNEISNPGEIQLNNSQKNESEKLIVQNLFDELTRLFIRLYKSKASFSPVFARTIHESIEMQDYFGITARGSAPPGKDLDDMEIYFINKLFKIIPNSAQLSYDPDRIGKYGVLLKKESDPSTIKDILQRFFNHIINFVNDEFKIELEFKGNISL